MTIGPGTLRLGAAVMAAGLCLGAASHKPAMNSTPVKHMASRDVKLPAVEATEALYRGDLVADTGVGCNQQNAGPGDWATKVTATTLVPPFGVVSTTFDISGSSQTWDLVAWNNGSSPGSEIQRCHLGIVKSPPGIHVVPVAPGCLTIPAAAGQTFFFGFSQGTDPSSIRYGQDTGGSTPGTVFIRNPACGLPSFVPVEAIGFPGYWVERIIVDDTVPIELMNFELR